MAGSVEHDRLDLGAAQIDPNPHRSGRISRGRQGDKGAWVLRRVGQRAAGWSGTFRWAAGCGTPARSKSSFAMSYLVIANPRAGAGRAAGVAKQVDQKLRQRGHAATVTFTKGPLDAARISRQACQDGVRTLVVVGGDGTLNEVSQCYIDAEGNRIAGPQLALVPAGTGGDFRRTIGLDADLDAALERLETGATSALDLGVVEYVHATGERRCRAFLNIASCGISGQVDELSHRSPKWMGGKATYALGTIKAAIAYRNIPVEVTVDGATCHRGKVFLVAIANGRFFGGGMKVAPDADPQDGWFEVVVIKALSMLQLAWLFPRAYAGTHLCSPLVHVRRARSVRIEPLRPGPWPPVDLDGETPGGLPLRAWLHAGAVELRG
jgi:YegS/Rv2252/BmrU family lipid kinase